MEKVKKYLFVLLALFLFRQWVSGPYISQMEGWKSEMTALGGSISRAKALLKQGDELEKLSLRVQQAGQENKTWLITDVQQQGVALTGLQKQFNRILTQARFDVGSLSLGEPVSPENTGYTRLPLSFNATATPEEFILFLEAVSAEKPLVVLESLNVQARRKNLQVSGQVAGFLVIAKADERKGENRMAGEAKRREL